MTDFPLTKFNEWLAKQPEEREFDYSDFRECLFAKFAQEALGLTEAYAGPGYIVADGRMLTPAAMEAFLQLPSFPNHFTIAQFRKQLEAANVA